MPKVGEMELDELRQWIEMIVEQKLLEMLGDPDEGLALRPEIAERVRRTLAEIAQGQTFVPAQEVAKELGLEWRIGD